MKEGYLFKVDNVRFKDEFGEMIQLDLEASVLEDAKRLLWQCWI